MFGDGADTIFIPKSAFTLQGFREWSWSDEFPQEGRISFIDGEIFVDMSKERLQSHVGAKGEIYRVNGSLVQELDLGKFYPDGTGVTNRAARISHVPDAVFVSWQSLETKRVRLVPSPTGDDFLELEGSPDWVLEVVSPSSVAKDTELLFKRYHRARIAEYWLIDARSDDVQFIIYVWSAKAYTAQPNKNGWQWSPVFGRHFRLRRSKDRIGGWQFQLELKA